MLTPIQDSELRLKYFLQRYPQQLFKSLPNKILENIFLTFDPKDWMGQTQQRGRLWKRSRGVRDVYACEQSCFGARRARSHFNIKDIT